MVDVDTGITLKKRWFISSKQGKIEDYYSFDLKKVIIFTLILKINF